MTDTAPLMRRMEDGEGMVRTLSATEDQLNKWAAFLEEAAKYFRHRLTGGEDSAFWANIYNGDNCEKVANFLRSYAASSSASSPTMKE